jgi:hypothetical protein
MRIDHAIIFENVIILKKKLKILKSYENFESFEIL